MTSLRRRRCSSEYQYWLDCLPAEGDTNDLQDQALLQYLNLGDW